MTALEMVQYIVDGIGITVKLVPCVVVSTLIVGILVGVVRFRKIPVVSQIIDLYVTAMRGIPPLVVLMMLYFTVNMSSAFMTAFVALTLYHGAYVSEVVRGGLTAIPRGQMEAGKSLGLGFVRIMFSIYLPQIMKQIIPTLCGQYILVVKDTTLVSVVGLQDLMWNAKELMAVTYKPMEIYLIVGLIYFVICWVIDIIANRVENKVTGVSKARMREVTQ